MIIIKIYSQDLYVASEVSLEYTKKVAKVLGVNESDVFFVGSEGVLVGEGVEQISWFTYLEVSLLLSLKSKQVQLSKLLQEIFASYSVHIMIKYDYVESTNIVKIINPEYPVFNKTIVDVTPPSYYDYDDEEEDDYDDEDDDF